MNSFARRFLLCAPALALAALLSACTTPRASSSGKLRVGLAPDLPPLAFMQGEKVAGLEVDLARQLAVALGRPVDLFGMPWNELFEALQEGRVDVVMGGVTITRAREVQMAFTRPVIESGLMAMVRGAERQTMDTPAALARSGMRIGVIPGSTGDAFVQREFSRARRIALSTVQDAPLELQRKEIDAFVYDLPTVIWLHSQNEATTALIMEPLQREQLGWALRQIDVELKDSIDGVLAQWKKDGTLDATILRWMPYYPRLLDSKPK